MVTHNQIIKAFETFCNEHLQINSFYSGQTWNFQTKSNIYPAVIMLPTPGTIQQGKITMSYNIFIADILNTDRLNLDEIYSDTLLMATDICSYFRDNDELNFMLEEEAITVEPFEEDFDDILAGWILTVSLQIPYTSNTCYIPKTDLA